MQRSRWRRRLVGGLVLFFCVFSVGLVYRYWPRPPLNAILITLGTTRADHLGCYGSQPAQTAALDELAQNGVLFEKAYSSIPLTLPSHATIFTSLYPVEHGVSMEGKYRLGSDVPVLAEILKTRSYDTGAFLSASALNAKFGLDRGFDTYDDAFQSTETDATAQPRPRDGDSVMSAALEWLTPRRTRPFFCWIHISNPPFPYDARQETFGETFAEHPYDAGVAFADLQIRRLTDFLRKHNLTKQTLVVVVGDHGEGLMEHDEQQHGMQLYNSTLQVPLIVAGPRFIQPGVRVAVPVSLVDITPTILNSLGIGPAMRRYRGTPLNSALVGQGIRPRVFHIETHLSLGEHRENRLVGLVTAGWKYIHRDQPQLFNLQVDPGETTNVATTEERDFKRIVGWFHNGQHNMEKRNAPLVDQKID